MHPLPPANPSEHRSWRSWAINRPSAMLGQKPTADAFRDYRKAIALLDKHRVKVTPPFKIMLILAFSVHLLAVSVWSAMTHRLLDEMPVSMVEIYLGDMNAEDTGGTALGGEDAGAAEVADLPSPPAAAKPAPPTSEVRARPQPRPASRSVASRAPVPPTVAPEAPAAAPETPVGNPFAEQAKPTSLQARPQGSGYLLGAGTGGEKAGQGNLYGNVTTPTATIQARYEQKLSAWLERFRIYPRSARNAGQQGQVLIRVRIDRQGHVLGKWIEHSSGFPTLDNAVIEQVGRADPFPAAPAEYPGQSQLEFRFPVMLTITG